LTRQLESQFPLRLLTIALLSKITTHHVARAPRRETAPLHRGELKAEPQRKRQHERQVESRLLLGSPSSTQIDGSTPLTPTPATAQPCMKPSRAQTRRQSERSPAPFQPSLSSSRRLGYGASEYGLSLHSELPPHQQGTSTEERKRQLCNFDEAATRARVCEEGWSPCLMQHKGDLDAYSLGASATARC
jgi:hypothetical protein